jgi:WD40 repeat protein
MDQPATELARHAGGVSGAAISPDGSVGASAGQDGIVHVWKLVDRTKAGELHGHALGAVDGLEFSPDGGLLASGGEDGTIRLWDATSLAPRWVVSGHGDWVASVAFSPDGERLASGGGDGRVRVWNVVDGALVQEFEGHEDTVRSVAFDLKRPALYSASEDKTIRVWDLEKGGPSSLVEGGVLDRRDDRWVRKLVIEPDGASLLEVFFNRGCAYFELGAATFGKIREISGLEGNSRAAAIFFNQDGHSCIAYGLEEGAIHLGRHERNFHVSRALLGHDAQVNSLAASSDGRFLLSGDSQGRVLLWDLRRPTGVVREWSPPNFAAWAVLTLDGETLLFRSIPGTTVGAFDIRSFAVMREWDGGDGAEIGVASPDGRFLVEHGWKGGIVVHSVDEGRVLHRLALKEGARAVLILEGDPIAAVGRDGGTTFVDLRSGQVVARVEIGCDVLGAARAGGSDVLLACSDGCVRWLDASARVVHKTMRVDDEGIFAVALSPDGQTLAAGGHLHLTVLEAATGRLVARRSHRKSVGVVQFLFGGRCLMTNDEDASTRLWDASSWQYSGTLAPLDVDGEGISTSSDGLRLAQRSHKRVRILDLRP